MFRSLISLLILAGLNTSPLSTNSTASEFDMATLLNIKPIPITQEAKTEPLIGAKAALVMDVDTGIILYQKNAKQQLPIASLTKIMTATLILESHALNEVVTVKNNFYNFKEDEIGVTMGLKKDEKITIENLLTGLLVRSGGDAAITLAEYHSGSIEAFVVAMNEKAKILNLTNTNFTNPIGLDHPKHYSNTFDLAILTKFALRNKDFRRIVNMPTATAISTNGQTTHQLNATNQLLLNNDIDVRGVKTGTTDGAGESLINLAYSKAGKQVIVVLLNSPARFTESKKLITWSFDNFVW